MIIIQMKMIFQVILIIKIRVLQNYVLKDNQNKLENQEKCMLKFIDVNNSLISSCFNINL